MPRHSEVTHLRCIEPAPVLLASVLLLLTVPGKIAKWTGELVLPRRGGNKQQRVACSLICRAFRTDVYFVFLLCVVADKDAAPKLRAEQLYG